MLPWQALEPRGVELRLVPLEGLADAVDERTAVVCVSLVQSADGRVADLDALRATGPASFWTRRRPSAPSRSTSPGSTTSSRTATSGCSARAGSGSSTSAPNAGTEVGPWTAGWKARVDPYEDYYGCPRCRTRRAGSTCRCRGSRRPGHERARGSLSPSGTTASRSTTSAWPRSLTAKLGLPEPESPIVRFRVADAESAAANLQDAGIACAVGRGRPPLVPPLQRRGRRRARSLSRRGGRVGGAGVIRLLVRIAVAAAASAIGLIVAAALLDGVHLNGAAFFVAVAIFTTNNCFLHRSCSCRCDARGWLSWEPRYSPLIALIAADLLSDGLTIEGAGNLDRGDGDRLARRSLGGVHPAVPRATEVRWRRRD